MSSKLYVRVYFFLALYNCTIFSGSIFFRSYVSTIIGARVKIRTPIMTWKNYDPKKKRYSCLASYVFQTTRKNYNPKKKWYSRLTDGWNKSQITVYRVKIQTHQLWLEKIMIGKKSYDTVVWLSVVLKYEHHQSHSNLRKFLLGFFIFTETMRSKLSITVYVFLALYGSTTIQSWLFLKNI